MSNQPIGIFDSGLGGISVMRAVRKLLPAEDLLYLGDCLYAPYGDRDEEYITERCFSICDYLLNRSVKAVVVACNTATAAAVNKLRLHYDIPIIGIEPAIKPAIASTYCGKVGVLATTRTINSKRYKSLLDSYGKEDVEVISVACPGLMDCVEKGDWDSAQTTELIKKYTDPLLKAGVDQVVLGCTHYPFLAKQIASHFPTGTHLIDPSLPVARELAHRLSLIQKLRQSGPGSEEFMVTGPTESPEKVISLLWDSPVRVHSVNC